MRFLYRRHLYWISGWSLWHEISIESLHILNRNLLNNPPAIGNIFHCGNYQVKRIA